ncbi:MAG: peptidyl-prolyl cis-trans isomerase [Elusimicrobia bacterium]|nr:peptidyl-prolyl cis-trans isomerase [Elusimicrobiota bacterium]
MAINMPVVVLILSLSGPWAGTALAAAASKAAVETKVRQAAEDPEIVKINGTAIRQSEFQDRLLQEYGQVVMENMINRVLLIQEAKSRKIAADPADIEKKISAFKSQFPNDEALDDLLKSRGDTLESLHADIANQLTVEKLVAQATGITATDKEVREAFDKNKENFTIPPTRHLRVIWVKTKAEAEEIVAKVKAGADWNALAAERNIAPSKKFVPSGDYGFRAQSELPSEIGKPAFAMKVGETKALQSKAGHHVMQVLEAKPAQAADFEKIKPHLREAVLNKKLTAALPEFVKGIREKADIQFLGPQKGKKQ